MRSFGSFRYEFNDKNKLVFIKRDINFDSIKNEFKSKEDKGLPNSNIGVLDLETYEKDSKSYCYGIGFYTSIDNKVNNFYIDEDKDSDKLILTCIDEMLKSKYKGFIFYVHNLGGFDAPFILRAINNWGG